MATKTSKTTKKIVAAKAVVSNKKQSVKKQVASKPATKKVAPLKSFVLGKESTPFLTFKVTDQTIYWSVLALYISILTVWVLNIQMDTIRLIESIGTF